MLNNRYLLVAKCNLAVIDIYLLINFHDNQNI